MKLVILFLSLLTFSMAVNFKVTAFYPQNQLKSPLFLRGSGCGLSWTTGIKMTQVSSDQWESSLNCVRNEQTLDLKVLIGDSTWMIGANQVVSVSESSATMYPWFKQTEGTF